MKKIFLLFAIFAVVLSSCSKDKVESSLTISPSNLSFTSAGGSKTFEITSNVEWQITADTWCVVNKTKGSNNAVINVTVSANAIATTRTAQIVVKSAAGDKYVTVAQEEGVVIVPKNKYLPLMTITTEGKKSISNKTDYIKGSIKIEERNNDGIKTHVLFETNMTKDGIRGRGNSTWGMEKKPYRLKLDNSVEVLGMPKSKHWVLLANYSDKTLIRNDLAFEISRRMGYAYTPRQKYVDVILNDNYVGNYMLCEHIRIDKNRVDISEGTSVSGGFLFEIDERKDDIDQSEYIETKGSDMNGSNKVIICIKTPERPDLTSAQLTYIKKYFQDLEDVLYGRNSVNPVTKLKDHIDLNSFIDNFLINEMSKNVDGNLRLSTFMYKKETDNKLYFGPVWDYDIAFGNADYDDGFTTDGWRIRNHRWYKEFFKHPEFEQMVKNRWKELRADKLSNASLFAYIDQVAENINLSQQENFKRWNILSKKVWPNYVATGSYAGEINYLKKDFLEKRLAWMDSQLK